MDGLICITPDDTSLLEGQTKCTLFFSLTDLFILSIRGFWLLFKQKNGACPEEFTEEIFYLWGYVCLEK